jgi:hypothetical protein
LLSSSASGPTEEPLLLEPHLEQVVARVDAVRVGAAQLEFVHGALLEQLTNPRDRCPVRQFERFDARSRPVLAAMSVATCAPACVSRTASITSAPTAVSPAVSMPMPEPGIGAPSAQSAMSNILLDRLGLFCQYRT